MDANNEKTSSDSKTPVNNGLLLTIIALKLTVIAIVKIVELIAKMCKAHNKKYTNNDA